MGVDEPRREELWDPPPQPGPPREAAPDHDGPPGALSTRAKASVGALIGVLYAVTFAINGDALPGVVGGALAGILCFLVLREVERQRAAKRRRRRS